MTYKALRANVQINFSSTKPSNLYGDPIKFGQIVTNLLANAIEASENSEPQNSDPENKTKTVEIILRSNKQAIILTVADQGLGIAPENINKIFEPFFSTKKEAGRGLGLGLASTKNIIEKNFDGTITVSSTPEQGSLFTVTLPFNRQPHGN